MADISFTPADVVEVGSNSQTYKVAAGVTVAAGDFVTLDSNNELILTDNDADATSTSKLIFMALSSGTAGQPVAVALPNSTINVGSVLAVATPYFLSSTAAKMCPRADLATGDRVVSTGYSKSATQFYFSPINYGVTL
jgi:hypothetical protein